jgi:hypothetical protein
VASATQDCFGISGKTMGRLLRPMAKRFFYRTRETPSKITFA